MDNKNIQKLVVHSIFGDNPNTISDEYRSVKIQVDNFLKHVEQEDSPLKWMPIEIMTDLEISQVILAYIDRSKENRLLLDNIEHKGLKYDYTDLIATDPDKERDKESILEFTPVLGTFTKLKIQEEIAPMKTALRNCKRGNFLAMRDYYADWSTTILANIIDEKRLIFCIGIGFTYVDYIEQYMSFVESMVIESLMRFIITNDYVQDKSAALTIIEGKLAFLPKMMNDRVEKSESDLTRRREQFHLDQQYADMISLYYVQFLSRRAKYDEMDIIYEALQNEVLENPDLFANPTLPDKESLDEYISKDLKRLITEGTNVPDYSKKLYETQQLIDIMAATGYHYFSSRNPFDVKPIFRELFMSDCTYRENKAMSIARGILKKVPNITIEAQQTMFLDAKIARGYFRQWNMMPEYTQFTRIVSNFRKQLLRAYSALDDEHAYYMIRDAGQFAMYAFFCDPKIE